MAHHGDVSPAKRHSISSDINETGSEAFELDMLNQLHDNDELDDEDSSVADQSDYSLDYEYFGPRQPVFRNQDDADSDASELSSSTESSFDETRFDMWDEDPYSTNDFTWESNEMRLTTFIKARNQQLAYWAKRSFWRKEKGWPRQLPSSCSTTNHDQSANALCLVLSDFGLNELLYTVYKDRIVACGNVSAAPSASGGTKVAPHRETTWIDSDDIVAGRTTPAESTKFCETHLSVSLPRATPRAIPDSQNTFEKHLDCLSRTLPYTKYIKRAHFPPIFSRDAYVALGFEPLCLELKYGYMAIGGIEGEFELYCCVDRSRPNKIWGTKFKSRNNVILMTNAAQIFRWPKAVSTNSCLKSYTHILILCMNEAGVLVYKLPPHDKCTTQSGSLITLHTQLHCFDRIPINDAKISPSGDKMVCVGDERFVFVFDVTMQDDEPIFSSPKKLPIPVNLINSPENSERIPYSSQYVSWSRSSQYFAHTSDTHNTVLVWRADTLEIVHAIDAAGYTYAIKFHPLLDSILVFTNRYGYFHTIDLQETVDVQQDQSSGILTFDQQTIFSRGHSCTPLCVPNQNPDHAAYHTRHLSPRHEITMVSFRGEKDRRLRILSKINGIQWSKNGRYLYLSTKKRVLIYEFMPFVGKVESLFDIAIHAVHKAIHPSASSLKRKRPWCEESITISTKRLLSISRHIHDILLDQAQVASH